MGMHLVLPRLHGIRPESKDQVKKGEGVQLRQIENGGSGKNEWGEADEMTRGRADEWTSGLNADGLGVTDTGGTE